MLITLQAYRRLHSEHSTHLDFLGVLERLLLYSECHEIASLIFGNIFWGGGGMPLEMPGICTGLYPCNTRGRHFTHTAISRHNNYCSPRQLTLQNIHIRRSVAQILCGS